MGDELYHLSFARAVLVIYDRHRKLLHLDKLAKDTCDTNVIVDVLRRLFMNCLSGNAAVDSAKHRRSGWLLPTRL